MRMLFKGLLLAGLASAGVVVAAHAGQSQHGFNPASLDADGDGVISMSELDAHAASLWLGADRD